MRRNITAPAAIQNSDILALDDIACKYFIGGAPSAAFERITDPSRTVVAVYKQYCNITVCERLGRDAAELVKTGQIPSGNAGVVLIYRYHFRVQQQLLYLRCGFAEIVPEEQRSGEYAPQREMCSIFLERAAAADSADITFSDGVGRYEKIR